MHENNEFEEICSISQMADKLKLSRSRFCQLRMLGKFPPPVYCLRNKRPFYPLELQKICLRIRETGIGLDGQPVFLYKPREKQAKQKSKMTQKENLDSYKEWASILKDWGTKVTADQVYNAVKLLFPKGLPENQNDNSVIRSLYKHFNPEDINDG